ncbi:MAG: COG2426 family protein [Spirochaetota bacterium]
MSGTIIVHTILLALLPISELRGALPYAYFNGIPLNFAYFISVTANALVAPLLFIFFSTFHRLLYPIRLYRRIFDASVNKARSKMSANIEKYGYLAVMLFVAIPLPITGAYTGTLGAWIMGLGWKRTSIAALAGVLISGLIVSALILLGVGTHSIFIKNV